MIYLTRKFEFSASHRIYDPSLSNEDNNKLFGKCSNPNGHGHNYVLEVTVSGEINPGTGYIIDIKDIKTIVNREIIDKVDHKNLNIDVEFMSGVIPTTENIVFKFWKVIVDKINSDNRKLYSLKLFETPNNSVEYRGEIYG
ncbi:MAG: 6-carboxytetrahydropterin synthase [Ignavibacteria bacterium]|jgi:6-pyruvoyltetrahydropterin/6-carboxytetrahydropterin synthase